MIILCTAYLVRTFHKCGMQWEGAASAWLLAAMLDALLIGLLIENLTSK